VTEKQNRDMLTVGPCRLVACGGGRFSGPAETRALPMTEFASFLCLMSHGSLDQRLHFLFGVFDADRDSLLAPEVLIDLLDDSIPR
jgi:hypothetical protein